MEDEKISLLWCVSVCISAFFVGVVTGVSNASLSLDVILFSVLLTAIGSVVVLLAGLLITAFIGNHYEDGKATVWIACIIAAGFVFFGGCSLSKIIPTYCRECGNEMTRQQVLCDMCYFGDDPFDKLHDLIADEILSEEDVVSVVYEMYGEEPFVKYLEASGYLLFSDTLEMIDYLTEKGYIREVK